jgi:predicted amidophosphoribosyltransferase
MVERLDDYRTRNEGRCADCDRWTSRLSRGGYCPACAGHARNAMAEIHTLVRAARGDLNPLDGGPDDPPPAA